MIFAGRLPESCPVRFAEDCVFAVRRVKSLIYELIAVPAFVIHYGIYAIYGPGGPLREAILVTAVA